MSCLRIFVVRLEAVKSIFLSGTVTKISMLHGNLPQDLKIELLISPAKLGLQYIINLSKLVVFLISFERVKSKNRSLCLPSTEDKMTANEVTLQV